MKVSAVFYFVFLGLLVPAVVSKGGGIRAKQSSSANVAVKSKESAKVVPSSHDLERRLRQQVALETGQGHHDELERRLPGYPQTPPPKGEDFDEGSVTPGLPSGGGDESSEISDMVSSSLSQEMSSIDFGSILAGIFGSIDIGQIFSSEESSALSGIGSRKLGATRTNNGNSAIVASAHEKKREISDELSRRLRSHLDAALQKNLRHRNLDESSEISDFISTTINDLLSSIDFGAIISGLINSLIQAINPEAILDAIISSIDIGQILDDIISGIDLDLIFGGEERRSLAMHGPGTRKLSKIASTHLAFSMSNSIVTSLEKRPELSNELNRILRAQDDVALQKDMGHRNLEEISDFISSTINDLISSIDIGGIIAGLINSLIEAINPAAILDSIISSINFEQILDDIISGIDLGLIFGGEERSGGTRKRFDGQGIRKIAEMSSTHVAYSMTNSVAAALEKRPDLHDKLSQLLRAHVDAAVEKNLQHRNLDESTEISDFISTTITDLLSSIDFGGIISGLINSILQAIDPEAIFNSIISSIDFDQILNGILDGLEGAIEATQIFTRRLAEEKGGFHADDTANVVAGVETRQKLSDGLEQLLHASADAALRKNLQHRNLDESGEISGFINDALSSINFGDIIAGLINSLLQAINPEAIFDSILSSIDFAQILDNVISSIDIGQIFSGEEGSRQIFTGTNMMAGGTNSILPIGEENLLSSITPELPGIEEGNPPLTSPFAGLEATPIGEAVQEVEQITEGVPFEIGSEEGLPVVSLPSLFGGLETP